MMFYNKSEETRKRKQRESSSRLNGVQHDASIKKYSRVTAATLLERALARHSMAEPLTLSLVISEVDMSGSPESEVHRCSQRRVALGEARIAQSTRPSAEQHVPHVAAKTSVSTCTNTAAQLYES